MAIDLSAVLHAFGKIKKRTKKAKVHVDEVQDWTQLKEGDIVRSVRGHGPYYVNCYGDKIYKGEYGYFKIDSLDYNGIHVYEYSPRGAILYHGGRRFIYMGEIRKVDIMHRQPHKLIKVNK